MSNDPALTLFYSPRACSLACHIALEESGLPFATKEVRIRENQHKDENYRQINRWGKIPALMIGDQLAVTERPDPPQPGDDFYPPSDHGRVHGVVVGVQPDVVVAGQPEIGRAHV